MSKPRSGFNAANNEPTGYSLGETHQGTCGHSPYGQPAPPSPERAPQHRRDVASPYRAFTRNDRPAVGMGTAVKLMFKNYARFHGRASRSEYWFAALALGLAYSAMVVPLVVALSNDWPALGVPLLALMTLFMVGTVVPAWSLQVRRLHDGGLSGWWTLWNVTAVGSVVTLVLSACDPKSEGARFDDPGGSQPARD